MARSTTNDELLLNDGSGRKSPIATGVYISQAIDMSERRRLSITGDFTGGFTGILKVEGTDEIANCSVSQGTNASVAWAGAGGQPGQNGYTGATLWQQIPSGFLAVTNSTTKVLLSLPDVCCRFIRLNFNGNVASPTVGTAIGSAVGSGAIRLFITAKNT